MSIPSREPLGDPRRRVGGRADRRRSRHRARHRSARASSATSPSAARRSHAELPSQVARAALGRHGHGREPAEDRGPADARPASGRPRAGARSTTPSPRGPDLPVLYSAMQVGRDGRVVAVGRDLRAMAALQQRLVDAQQSMERDYARLRHVETRYRLLFQIDLRGGADRRRREPQGGRGQPGRRPAAGRAGQARWSAEPSRKASTAQSAQACSRAAGRGPGDGPAPRTCARAWPKVGRELLVVGSLFRQENALALPRPARSRLEADAGAGPGAEPSQAAPDRRERARRLRGHRPRRPDPDRQRRLPRPGPARDRGAGARRVAGPLARAGPASTSTC